MSLAFAPDGKSLASFSNNRNVRVWNLETQNIITNFPASPEGGSYKGVVLFSPDGKWLAVNGPNYQAQLWELITGKRLFSKNVDDVERK